MKTLITLILISIISPKVILAQNTSSISNLNAYKYIEVQPPFRGADYNTVDKNTLQTTYYLEELLMEKGFMMVPRDSTGKTPTYGGLIPMPVQVQKNKCLTLNFFWGYSGGGTNELKTMAVNCKDEILFTGSYKMKHQNDYNFKKLLTPVFKADYKFDEALNHKLFIPKVNSSTETEETLREYLTTQNPHPIEGIYKSVTNEFQEDPASYKIGIKYKGGRYQIIVLETDNSTWTAQEIKGYLETTENTNLLSTTYFLSNKDKVEGFSSLNDLVLSLSLRVNFSTFIGNGFKENQKTIVVDYIKTFPK